jgi:hypothetical protein
MNAKGESRTMTESNTPAEKKPVRKRAPRKKPAPATKPTPVVQSGGWVYDPESNEARFVSVEVNPEGK